MLRFENLEGCSADTLLDAFNASFADYIVPLQLNREQLEQKLAGDSVQLRLSVGAFADGQLAGFILHGINRVNGQPAVYNAGTGVRPGFRGQRATAGMYSFIMPQLKAEGVRKATLEVIDRNIPAIKSYKAVGYAIHRDLVCFRGLPGLGGTGAYTVQEIAVPDWEQLKTFWDWEPSWQNSITALRNIGAAQTTVGIYHAGKVVAYASYNPQNKRIAQFAVDKMYRRKGLGKALFGYICGSDAMPCTLINIDAGAKATSAFLASIGLEPFITQHEMTMSLV